MSASMSSSRARTFEELIAEAEAVSVEGWDFSWLDGRASEERPAWGYARSMAERMARATAALDIQTGGGEVLASVPKLPTLTVATESWPPNLARATALLRPLGVPVVVDPDKPPLPFADGAFDPGRVAKVPPGLRRPARALAALSESSEYVQYTDDPPPCDRTHRTPQAPPSGRTALLSQHAPVVSRHPVRAWWQEIARVLRPGGTYFSQEVGPASVFELVEYFLGPQPPAARSARDPERAARDAEAAGLDVIDLRTAELRTEFLDIGAVVYFLRKVIWMVPGFTVERYRDRLEALHRRIEAEGPFVATTTRFLIEAVKPGS
nr:class I SAM-dependent methyltransferase [Streptomyces sp. NBC_00857]